MNRREIIKNFTTIASAAVVAGTAVSSEASVHSKKYKLDSLAALVDTTLCIGCRKCELFCDRAHKLTKNADTSFENKEVFDAPRRLDVDFLTVVNRYPHPGAVKPVFVKTQCMHCLRPSCVSACIVGALKKTENGPVVYDSGKCIGCRYCMVACPYQVPAYEYSEPLKPRVMKCDFCFDKIAASAGLPACIDACPVSALMFGKRDTLLEIAHRRIEANKDKYITDIYGEKEAGGASWLYLSSVPLSNLAMPALGETAPPELSEGLQHSVFKNWIPPVSLYILLALSMAIFKRKDTVGNETAGKESGTKGGSES